MFKSTISIIALMMLILLLGSSQAQSQVAENNQDLAEVITNEAADVQDAQAQQADEKDQKGTIMPGPPMNLPFPVAPPPSQGKTGYCGFFINADTVTATFTVKDVQGRKLFIKDNKNDTLPEKPGSGNIYEFNVANNETKAYLIGLAPGELDNPPLDLSITSSGILGEYFLLKIQN